MFILTKRRKFILSSLLLSFGLYLLEVVGFEYKYQAIAVLSFLAAILTFWSLRGAALNLASWLTPILPMFFTAGVALFYFLLPANLFTIVPIILVYFVGMYALLLTLNIFSVAAIRTINLFRSASAVGFLLTLLTGFFLYNAVISLKMHFYMNFTAVFLISFPLFLVGLWSVNLEEKIPSDILSLALVVSFLVAQLELILSFWPLTVTVGSLFLTASVYVLLGLLQAQRLGRLFKRTIREYLAVGIAVFLTMLFYASWG